jgi:flagellar biosynthesis protein
MTEHMGRKNKTAVALGYRPDEPAPKIIATGKGYLADKIIKSADENHIPVHQDEKLAGTLSKLDIGDYIPPELYEVVAEVLVFVDNMDHIKQKIIPNDGK